MTVKTNNPRFNRDSHPFMNMAGLWGLKILLNLNASSELSFYNMSNSLMLNTLGLSYLEDQNTDKKDFMQILRKQLYQYENKNPKIKGIFKSNINKFGKQLGLSKTDLQILSFTVVLYSDRGLEAAANLLGYPTRAEAIEYLSILLDTPVRLVQKSLSSKGALSRASILRFFPGAERLRGKLDLAEGLTEIILEPNNNASDLLNSYFHLASEPKLSPEDFTYLQKNYYLLKNYLQNSQEKNLSGVNILIHGRPGTGKSEIARTLAKSLQMNLFEISFSDKNSDPLTGNGRFSAYQLCQQALSNNKKAIILFDEIEDVFQTDTMDTRHSRKHKAWVNRLLEDNPVPAIWISNDIDQMDPAYIRRYDFVLKLDHPSRKVRKEILNKHLEVLNVSGQWIENMAENPDIAPAVISRASRVAVTLDTKGSQKQNLIWS